MHQAALIPSVNSFAVAHEQVADYMKLYYPGQEYTVHLMDEKEGFLYERKHSPYYAGELPAHIEQMLRNQGRRLVVSHSAVNSYKDTSS